MPHRKYRRYDPRRYYTHATTSWGRRGTFLSLIGMVWVAQGITTLSTPPNPDYQLLNVFPEIRAAAWIITGIIAIHFARRPPGEDAYGFLSLYVMAAYRVIAYGVSFLLWIAPGGDSGTPRAIVGVMSWLIIILAIVIIAGWDEPDQRQARS